ncbi:MAG: SDR family oxidoreductase [Chloroflexota bacterium]|nr:SDR family oxidoreductase [Chloroflexota bacterium]
MMNMELQGKGVFITGAGSGLGEATAKAFAGARCAVACVDINAQAAERVSEELRRHDVNSVALGCDVSDADAVFAAVNSAAERLGRLDIAVNCAAVDHTYSVEELTVAQWDQIMNVNLRGAFLVSKAVWPHLKRQGGGHIINIASTAGVRAWANTSAYHASKWGLIGFSRGLGVEGRAEGIRVTTVIPGGMRTHFFDRFAEQGIPMPDQENLQEPSTVADAILYAVRVPRESALQELILTPINETSWP